VRCILEGARGRGVVTIRFDDGDRLDGLSLDGHVFEGIGTIVIACPRERRGEVAAFYANLLGNDRRRMPRLAFGESRSGYRPPEWPDPDSPQQLHFDLLVRDAETAERLVLGSGATLLQDKGAYRSYADPVGHPFCLYPDESRPEDVDGPERVVIAKEDGGLPMLAFQHVIHYVAPRWPDSAYPQQMHFDLKFDDRQAAESLVQRLGALRLPDQGGSCPVYADPAGHPFCLCMPGE
jgi:hypothetical protein